MAVFQWRGVLHAVRFLQHFCMLICSFVCLFCSLSCVCAERLFTLSRCNSDSTTTTHPLLLPLEKHSYLPKLLSIFFFFYCNWAWHQWFVYYHSFCFSLSSPLFLFFLFFTTLFYDIYVCMCLIAFNQYCRIGASFSFSFFFFLLLSLSHCRRTLESIAFFMN